MTTAFEFLPREADSAEYRIIHTGGLTGRRAGRDEPAHSRTHRRKIHSAWEEADRASGGIFAQELDLIARRFPALSPMELRVSVLVKLMLPSWRIAEMLRISEKAVENYRVKIRRKIGCVGERLTSMLTKI